MKSDDPPAAPPVNTSDDDVSSSDAEKGATIGNESGASSADANAGDRVVVAPVGKPRPKLKLERRQELEQHLKSSPTDLDSYLELARIYRNEERPVEAKRILDQAHKIFPDDNGVLWELEEATLARSLQQFREVSDLAARLHTPEADHELSRSRSDWAARRMDTCRARLQRDPSLLHLHLVMAEAMVDAGMYEAATESLNKIVVVDEYSAQAHFIRGRCLLQIGKEAEAMVELRAAALRRAVVAPVKIRVAALRLLCESADRLGVNLTKTRYQQMLEVAETELANQS